jgi:hypothetical protein
MQDCSHIWGYLYHLFLGVDGLCGVSTQLRESGGVLAPGANDLFYISKGKEHVGPLGPRNYRRRRSDAI